MWKAEDKARKEDFFELATQLPVHYKQFAYVFGSIEGRLVFVGVVEGLWPKDGDHIWKAVVSVWLEESKEEDLEMDLGGKGKESWGLGGNCS